MELLQPRECHGIDRLPRFHSSRYGLQQVPRKYGHKNGQCHRYKTAKVPTNSTMGCAAIL